jgi:hypothetical protein
MGITEDQLTRFMARAMSLNSSPLSTSGSFATCAARYDGTISEQQLQKFILNISLHKDVEGITDEIALHELPLLLQGEAFKWWEELKENVCEWKQAMKLLKERFSPKKPPYQIYAEVFATKQDAYIKTEIFVGQKRALLDNLPQPHPEHVQIDMIYSLLRSQIRRKIPRDSITSFDQLLAEARKVEQLKLEKHARQWANFNFTDPTANNQLRDKCTYCKTRKRRRNEKVVGRVADRYKYLTPLSKRSKHLTPEAINAERQSRGYDFNNAYAKYFGPTNL